MWVCKVAHNILILLLVIVLLDGLGVGKVLIGHKFFHSCILGWRYLDNFWTCFIHLLIILVAFLTGERSFTFQYLSPFFTKQSLERIGEGYSPSSCDKFANQHPDLIINAIRNT